MAELVDPSRIEDIVGIERHPFRHYARADSAERKVYILHSDTCRQATPDLRDCAFSLALDRGIDEAEWGDHLQDRPVQVTIAHGPRLVPYALAL